MVSMLMNVPYARFDPADGYSGWALRSEGRLSETNLFVGALMLRTALWSKIRPIIPVNTSIPSRIRKDGCGYLVDLCGVYRDNLPGRNLFQKCDLFFNGMQNHLNRNLQIQSIGLDGFLGYRKWSYFLFYLMMLSLLVQTFWPEAQSTQYFLPHLS